MARTVAEVKRETRNLFRIGAFEVSSADSETIGTVKALLQNIGNIFSYFPPEKREPLVRDDLLETLSVLLVVSNLRETIKEILFKIKEMTDGGGLRHPIDGNEGLRAIDAGFVINDLCDIIAALLVKPCEEEAEQDPASPESRQKGSEGSKESVSADGGEPAEQEKEIGQDEPQTEAPAPHKETEARHEWESPEETQEGEESLPEGAASKIEEHIPLWARPDE